MRNAFVDCLIERASSDKRIFLITPDLGYSVLERFAYKYPDRFMNVGIAEQNAVGLAAGLALSGFIVYIYSIIPFVTMRCFEQIRVDAAYMNTNIRLIGVGAGLSYGAAGATHHAIEDIAIMRSLPNMTVCCPGDPLEVRELVVQSFEHSGPMYFRLGRGGEPCIHPPGTKVALGKAVIVKKGIDGILITTSNMLELGSNLVLEWEREGMSVGLISIPTIKPLDTACLLDVIKLGIPIRTLEEHNIIGGLGSAVAEVIAESGKGISFKRIGINDSYTHLVGSHTYLREKLGLNVIKEERWGKSH
jgi:transketolase